MFALDLFNTDHERRLTEGAVDTLEQRRIDDLAMKMDDLVARAKEPAYKKNPAALSALMKEFQKCKDERDSYFKIKAESMVDEGKADYNFDAEDLKRLERIRDLTTLKTQALELISRPSAKPMKPEKVEWFKNALEKMNSPLKVIKLMYDLLLSGEGHAVVGSKSSMNPNSYRQRFGEEEANEAGIPGNVPVEKIPGKEDLLKGKGRSYYEADQKKNSEVNKDQRLHVGDPVIVTGPNEFEGKTGEISEFSPSGKFVVINLYNHGEHSMHLSDVKYNDYADQQDDWYDEEDYVEEDQGDGQVAIKAADDAVVDTMDEAAVNPQFINNQVTKLLARATQTGNFDPLPQLLAPLMKQYNLTLQQIDAMISGGLKKAASEYGVTMKEGWSDAIVARRTGQPRTPYSVYIKGKKWKDFANDDLARAVMDRLKAKFKADGRDPETITIAPTNIPEGVAEGGFGRDEEFLSRERNAGLEHETNNIQIAINGKPWKVVPGKGYADSAEERAYLEGMKRWAEKKSASTGKKWTVYLTGANISEAETDYSKRRQREKDIDAGKPVPKQRTSKMTDYQKKRAQDKKDMELGEDQDTSGVESAIIRRIMVAHTDLLQQFGPEKVMQAAEEVAYNVGDVDEIGTSDVSAYVNQVKQILGAV